jgi:hypothetical protein
MRRARQRRRHKRRHRAGTVAAFALSSDTVPASPGTPHESAQPIPSTCATRALALRPTRSPTSSNAFIESIPHGRGVPTAPVWASPWPMDCRSARRDHRGDEPAGRGQYVYGPPAICFPCRTRSLPESRRSSNHRRHQCELERILCSAVRPSEADGLHRESSGRRPGPLTAEALSSNACRKIYS